MIGRVVGSDPPRSFSSVDDSQVAQSVMRMVDGSGDGVGSLGALIAAFRRRPARSSPFFILLWVRRDALRSDSFA